MALDFPQSPQLDEVFLAGDRAWKWNGYAWDKTDAQTGTNPYGVIVFFPDKPEPNELLLSHVAAWSATFPANLEGSQASAVTGATGQYDMAIKVNGLQKGTLRFAAGSATGSFLTADAFSLTAGDVITVNAPALTDATLSHLSITLAGSR